MNKYVWFPVLALIATPAFAQDWAPSGPPKVLAVTTEFLKPGQAATHEKIESGWPRAFRKANWPYHWLTVSSVSGTDRLLFLTGYQSFADAQADDTSQSALDWLRIEQEKLTIEDSAYVASKTHQTAVYEPDLSLRSNAPLGGARYLLVTSIEVEPAQEQEFRKQLRAYMLGKQRGAYTERWATYRIVLGARDASFVMFQPLQSMQALDQGVVSSVNNLPTAGVRTIRRDLMAFSPGMSYVSEEFAAGNTAFWFPD